jgi:hypothetical protein
MFKWLKFRKERDDWRDTVVWENLPKSVVAVGSRGGYIAKKKKRKIVTSSIGDNLPNIPVNTLLYTYQLPGFGGKGNYLKDNSYWELKYGIPSVIDDKSWSLGEIEYFTAIPPHKLNGKIFIKEGNYRWKVRRK